MKSTQTFLAIALGLVGLAARGTMAATPSKTTTLNIPMATSPSYVACYKSSGSLKKIRSDDGLSKGVCKDICVDEDVSSGGKGYSVMGMTSQFDCWCGNKLPNSADKVSDDKCSIMCPGMGTERCGSRLGDYTAIYISGLELTPEEETATSSSATSTKSDPPKTSTSSGPPPTSSAPEKKESGGVNKGAVAAGVVIGVLVILGIGVGAWLLIRKRNREKVEEEYRRSAAAREYAAKPNSDHRLDPGMVQRRDSVGSIADNQDYSRRILKVTNPDG